VLGITAVTAPSATPRLGDIGRDAPGLALLESIRADVFNYMTGLGFVARLWLANRLLDVVIWLVPPIERERPRRL
jgi:hypothetical protein